MCLDADDYCPYEGMTPGQIYDEWVHLDKEPKRDLDPVAEAAWEEFQYGMKESLSVVGYGLLLELPPETVVWKTANGEVWTVKTMQEQISRRTEIAEQYISDLLRVARDIVRQQNDKVQGVRARDAEETQRTTQTKNR